MPLTWGQWMSETQGAHADEPYNRQRACQTGVARVGPAVDTCDDSTQRPARQGVSSQAVTMRRLIGLLFTTGCMLGEALSLERGDLDR